MAPARCGWEVALVDEAVRRAAERRCSEPAGVRADDGRARPVCMRRREQGIHRRADRGHLTPPRAPRENRISEEFVELRSGQPALVVRRSNDGGYDDHTALRIGMRRGPFDRRSCRGRAVVTRHHRGGAVHGYRPAGCRMTIVGRSA